MLREGLKSPSVWLHVDLARRTPRRNHLGNKWSKWSMSSTSSTSSALLGLSLGRWRSYGSLRQRSVSVTALAKDLTVDNGSLVWAKGIESELPLSPTYLAKELAPSLLETGKAEGQKEATLLAHKILTQLSYEIGHILTLPAAERAGRLDGLMDLSPPTGNLGRELRRRLHQALDNMVRWFLHAPNVHLADVRGDPVQNLRTFASMAVIRKRQLRRLCQSSVAFSTSPPSELEEEEASVDAAAVHGLKQWSKAFKEFCFSAVRYYFLLDADLRSKWLTGRRAERFRVTVLTHTLRKLVADRGQQNLPRLSADAWSSVVKSAAAKALVDRPRVLDVGSCMNYFGRLHGDCLDVTAVDLAPGHPSVFGCNFLELTIGSSLKTKDGPEGLVAEELPAGHFDVVIMALLFSVLPSPEARGIAAKKARQVLKDSGRGLLIIADTKGTVGRHCDPAARSSKWIAAVEANGFTLASDPQLHLSHEHVKGRNGYWQRSFCWAFWTDDMLQHMRSSQPVPVPLLSDVRKPRGLSPERLHAQRLREEKRKERARKAQLLELANVKKQLLRGHHLAAMGASHYKVDVFQQHLNCPCLQRNMVYRCILHIAVEDHLGSCEKYLARLCHVMVLFWWMS